MIASFLDFLADNVFGFINGILGIFPSMPVNTDELTTLSGFDIVGKVLSWVNWFLPLDIAASIIALWAVAMMTYLGIKMAMRYTGEIV